MVGIPLINRHRVLCVSNGDHFLITTPSWRNRLARSAVNRKVGGSSPPGGGYFA